MKTLYNKLRKTAIRVFAIAAIGFLFVACDDFLDREPLSEVSPEQYLNTVESMAAYLDGKYVYYLPNHGYSNTTGYQYGIFKWDAGTDNQVGRTADDRFVGQTMVSDGSGDWDFSQIYECNWFIEQVEEKVNNGGITGDQKLAKHYLGEIYFMRAYLYFGKLKSLGDFPIITTTLPNDRDVLIEESKRMPCNEVGRFILSDLDKAALLMSEINLGTTRVSEAAAYLLKSRVALFEGTWLKNFKGTAFVPQGPEWPGFEKEYSKDYQYPIGNDIDKEIEYFLSQSMDAADKVAANATLTNNTGIVPQVSGETNPYLEMFGDVNLTKYPEVILWMSYGEKLTTHGAVIYAQQGNNGVGLTRGFVDNFLMKNGLPIYASGSGYKGDSTFSAVRSDRDLRLTVFLKEPGQKNWIYDSETGGAGTEIEVVPGIDKAMNVATGYCTGYAMRKGNSLYKEQSRSNGSWTGAVVFRQAEALLNYIEACYEKDGSLDAKATAYWTALRNRSGITAPIETTVNATVMSEEAKNDWAAYSAGQLIDPTLYNIRRERRSEFIGDGLRYMDLCRWRAMDQLIETPYHVEGIHIWDPVMENYLTSNGVYLIESDRRATVSPRANSEYFRIYQIGDNQALLGYGGLYWKMGHYLNPIGAREFLKTAPDGASKETSPIYQNPFWSKDASTFAEK